MNRPPGCIGPRAICLYELRMKNPFLPDLLMPPRRPRANIPPKQLMTGLGLRRRFRAHQSKFSEYFLFFKFATRGVMYKELSRRICVFYQSFDESSRGNILIWTVECSKWRLPGNRPHVHAPPPQDSNIPTTTPIFIKRRATTTTTQIFYLFTKRLISRKLFRTNIRDFIREFLGHTFAYSANAQEKSTISIKAINKRRRNQKDTKANRRNELITWINSWYER